MDLITTFTSCRPSLSTILEMFPPLLPRPYSLLNYSNECEPRPIEFAFTSIKFNENTDVWDIEGVQFQRYNRKAGVCTSWLQQIWIDYQTKKLETCITAFLRCNFNRFLHPSVELSPSVNSPLIMIAAGTGISPFIGYLQYRRHLMKKVCR